MTTMHTCTMRLNDPSVEYTSILSELPFSTTHSQTSLTTSEMTCVDQRNHLFYTQINTLHLKHDEACSLKPGAYWRFALLPREIQLDIFSYLSKMDLITATQVSRAWRSLALDASFWHIIDARHWGYNITDAQFQLVTSGHILRQLCLQGCSHLQPSTLVHMSTVSIYLETLILTGCHQLDAMTLHQILAMLPHLRHLNLAGLSCVTDEAMYALRAPQLETLNLSRCRKLTFQGLQHTLEYGIGKHLKVLKLAGCHHAVNNSILQTIGKHHLNLRHLNLASCYHITDEGICDLLKSGIKLERLSLAICHRISDDTAREIGHHGQYLTHLDLSGCTDLSDIGLIPMIRGCPNLELIDLEDCLTLTDDLLQVIANSCPKLRDISLGSCEGITDEGVKTLMKGCKMLQHIAVDNCPALSDSIFDEIHQNLQCIEVFDCHMISEVACLEAEMRIPGLQVRSFYAWITEEDHTSRQFDASIGCSVM